MVLLKAIFTIILRSTFMSTTIKFFSILLIFGIVISAFTIPSKKYLDLSSLIENKDYQIAIQHNPKGCHYLNPMLLNFTNKSNEDVYIVVKSGDIYTPSDAGCQDLVTTKTDTLFVQKSQAISKSLAGMCIEHHDKGGYGQITYRYLKSADAKLKQLTDFISVKNYQSGASQGAIWDLVENVKDYSIYSNDKTELIGLSKAMEKITGHKPKTEEEILASNRTYYSPPVYQNKYWGEFAFKQNHVTNLKLGLFNKRGIQVRELYNNPVHAKGDTKIAFAFDMAQYTDSTYMLILVKNQEIVSRTILKPYEN